MSEDNKIISHKCEIWTTSDSRILGKASREHNVKENGPTIQKEKEPKEEVKSRCVGSHTVLLCDSFPRPSRKKKKKELYDVQTFIEKS